MRHRFAYSETKLLAMSEIQIHKAAAKILDQLALMIADWDSCRALIAEYDKVSSFLPPSDPLSQIARELNQATTPHQLLPIISAWQDRQHKTFKDSQIHIRTRDGSPSLQPERLIQSQKIIVVLDNLRSVFNVGSIFRSSECLALGGLYLCGITPTPEHPNLPKTAMGTHEHVPWRYFDTTEHALTELKRDSYKIYALETAGGAASVFETGFDFPMALLLGNESLGIAPEILSLCDQIVDLPVLGWKNSLNVGVAFAISAYQIVFNNETRR